MNTFRADLHCHSTCSDGSLNPNEIIQLAKKVGLEGLSITDHDTIEAYQTAPALSKELGIDLLTGVELSSSLQGTSVHILAYGFAPDSQEISEFCMRHGERRQQRNQEILNLLTKHKMPLSYDDLTKASAVLPRSMGRPHIALAMVKKGYVQSLQEAFQKFIGEGRPCYTPGEPIGVEETLDAIHQAKALAVIAHPHLLSNGAVLNSLLNMKFDGIECYYGKYTLDKNQRWLKIAKKKGWLITGGSDFHGDMKPQLDLGCSWVDQPTFQAIKERLQ